VVIERDPGAVRICAASGTGRRYPERFGKDPTIHAVCPYCRPNIPKPFSKDGEEDAVCCRRCGNPIIPQTLENGYTVLSTKHMGLAATAPPALASEICRQDTGG
jgi:hypothetical protein